VSKPEDKDTAFSDAFDNKQLIASEPATNSQVFDTYAKVNSHTHLCSVSHWNAEIIAELQMTSPVVHRGYGILDVGKGTVLHLSILLYLKLHSLQKINNIYLNFPHSLLLNVH
jgi:hypothetical protein